MKKLRFDHYLTILASFLIVILVLGLFLSPFTHWWWEHLYGTLIATGGIVCSELRTYNVKKTRSADILWRVANGMMVVGTTLFAYRLLVEDFDFNFLSKYRSYYHIISVILLTLIGIAASYSFIKGYPGPRKPLD